jgi:hypothetical protein
MQELRVVTVDGRVDMVQWRDGTSDAALQPRAIRLGKHE